MCSYSITRPPTSSYLPSRIGIGGMRTAGIRDHPNWLGLQYSLSYVSFHYLQNILLNAIAGRGPMLVAPTQIMQQRNRRSQVPSHSRPLTGRPRHVHPIRAEIADLVSMLRDGIDGADGTHAFYIWCFVTAQLIRSKTPYARVSQPSARYISPLLVHLPSRKLPGKRQ